MLAKILATVSLLALCAGVLSATDSPELEHIPKLLLNAQRLRRLERDRERQTIWWVNFEARVQSTPDSPERGFELALYYAVTHDEKRGREAIEWALGHACDPRQFAWILDWCSDLLSEAERRRLETAGCTAQRVNVRERLQSLQEDWFKDARALYDDCELLIALRSAGADDPRREAPKFFSELPNEFLLSLKPDQVEHPDWTTHIAALALIAVDPNLEASQYLQGWAIEDRHMIRDGPGVAYEFLWADPYLPGVGYQNLDPWIYDSNGRLFARTSWDAQACWIGITKSGAEQVNCPASWRERPMAFGRMMLVPPAGRCVELPELKSNHAAIIWGLKPGEIILFREGKKQHSASADGIGLAIPPAGAQGKGCVAR